jgi:hypothetical protein
MNSNVANVGSGEIRQAAAGTAAVIARYCARTEPYIGLAVDTRCIGNATAVRIGIRLIGHAIACDEGVNNVHAAVVAHTSSLR